jgi:hypothetical protein
MALLDQATRLRLQRAEAEKMAAQLGYETYELPGGTLGVRPRGFMSSAPTAAPGYVTAPPLPKLVDVPADIIPPVTDAAAIEVPTAATGAVDQLPFVFVAESDYLDTYGKIQETTQRSAKGGDAPHARRREKIYKVLTGPKPKKPKRRIAKRAQISQAGKGKNASQKRSENRRSKKPARKKGSRS